MSIPIPDIAHGHEEIYQRFIGGKLIYKPDPNSDIGKIELQIASLLNPLESTFDLSRCGDTGNYLSISTGYKKGKIAANDGKAEVWIVPKFVVEKDVGGGGILSVFRTVPVDHYRDIINEWTAPFGLFYTWGSDLHFQPRERYLFGDIES